MSCVNVLKQLIIGNRVYQKSIYLEPDSQLFDFAKQVSNDKEFANRLYICDKEGNKVGKKVEEKAEPENAQYFISVDEFVSLNATKQAEYIEGIKETPANADGDKYEADLYNAVVEYSGVVKNKTVKALVNEILKEYE